MLLFVRAGRRGTGQGHVVVGVVGRICKGVPSDISFSFSLCCCQVLNIELHSKSLLLAGVVGSVVVVASGANSAGIVLHDWFRRCRGH